MLSIRINIIFTAPVTRHLVRHKLASGRSSFNLYFLTLSFANYYFICIMKLKPRYTIDEIRQKVSPIAKRYGVARVYLFGSYACSKAGAKSDVDLRIDAGNINDYFKLAQMYCELEESLSAKVDLLTTCALDESFLEKIAKEEVLIYAE